MTVAKSDVVPEVRRLFQHGRLATSGHQKIAISNKLAKQS